MKNKTIPSRLDSCLDPSRLRESARPGKPPFRQVKQGKTARLKAGFQQPVYRCAWGSSNPLYQKYHDEEWGVPVHDDRKLFEMLLLEGAQAGLSWITILRKRENYRNAFDKFEAKKIAKYNSKKVKELLQNEGIVRNKLKIAAAIQNAKCFLEIQKEYGSFDKYIWQFVNGKQIINKWKSLKEIPAKTKESDAMSKDLRKRGFKFVGSTICYAFMQAVGMVNDHTIDCFKYRQKN